MTELRTPPYNEKAERQLIAHVLLDDRCLEDLEHITPEHFYRESHRILWAACLEIRDRGDVVDPFDLVDLLKTRGTLEAAGGERAIEGMSSEAQERHRLLAFAHNVVTKANQRAEIARLEREVDTLYQPGCDFKSYTERAVVDAAALGAANVANDPRHIRQGVKSAFSALEHAYKNKDAGITGIDCGFAEVNEMLGGLQPTDLMILTGRPGMGKTAFALQIAMNAATLEGDRCKGTVVFSLEMSEERLCKRMMSMEGRVDNNALKSGRMTEQHWADLVGAAGRLNDMPIYIDETPALAILDLEAKTKAMCERHGNIGLIVIDYLQLMTAPHLGSRESRERVVGEISRRLKVLAKKLGIVVIALAQLNRECEKRADKRPMNSDLRESGSIEQDADVIIHMYRDEVYNESSEDRGKAELIFGKNRHGSTRTVKVKWTGNCTRFDDLEQDTRHGAAPKGFTQYAGGDDDFAF